MKEKLTAAGLVGILLALLALVWWTSEVTTKDTDTAHLRTLGAEYAQYQGGDNPFHSERLSRLNSVRVPVLMYHHVGDDGGGFSVTEENFRSQMELLQEKGYQPVSIYQLIDYANRGTALPHNPVCITFDDGYTSNYKLAYPILKEFDFPAVIFVVGSSVGKDTYKETGAPILPHFGLEEIEEMEKSGLISVQSHTYDLHQSSNWETSWPVRANILPFYWESEETYGEVLRQDHEKLTSLLKEGGVENVVALAFPTGKHNALVDRLVKDLGIRITFTTQESAENLVVRENGDSIYNLGRINMNDSVTDEVLLAYLEGN